MTMPIKFDTLQYTNSLIEAGIPADQAEAQAQALTQAMDEATVAPSELVLLRTDILARIEMLRIEMDGKFSELRAEMNGKFNELRAEMNGKFNELRAEMNGKFDAMRAYIDRKLTTVYWMIGLTLALQAVQITALIYIISRLP
jgi:DNA anti-recombination protein RmuC